MGAGKRILAVAPGRQGDLRIALESSDCAAELALAHFQAGVDAVVKADGSPVTEADRAVERLLHERLTWACPNDAFLGEELGALGTAERVWILDPIDGTSCFVRRDPHWRAVYDDKGRIVIAVLFNHDTGDSWEWADDPAYPQRYSALGIRTGVNYVVYALTH